MEREWKSLVRLQNQRELLSFTLSVLDDTRNEGNNIAHFLIMKKKYKLLNLAYLSELQRLSAFVGAACLLFSNRSSSKERVRGRLDTLDREINNHRFTDTTRLHNPLFAGCAFPNDGNLPLMGTTPPEQWLRVKKVLRRLCPGAIMECQEAVNDIKMKR